MSIYWQTTTTVHEVVRHPSASWANWKNDTFKAWDRDEQVEKEVTLPKEFIVVAESWSIKGYLADKGWVRSNEIYSFANDILTVRTNDWKVLFEWLWKDIKEKTKSLGLKLFKNVHYANPEEPEVIKTFAIKWAGLSSWLNEFKDDKKFVPANNRITLKEVANWKTGSVKYTYPVFEWATPLTAEDKAIQTALGAKLIAYKDATTTTKEEFEERKVAESAAWDDVLPF